MRKFLGLFIAIDIILVFSIVCRLLMGSEINKDLATFILCTICIVICLFLPSNKKGGTK